ncbi:stressosome-associated protein Prli42 [Jeotgalicoccus huakuii]|nr:MULTISPECIES: stressosome-associated protein Prli42 [Jeotgalicoccus]MCK1977155.1 stressosome-associated protein Prli42 [Jeotgalicoccus huakuii]QQD85444.1 stressosome-associated protein Prli42 [Jeotgalicoccus sp. ATCC 8456]
MQNKNVQKFIIWFMIILIVVSGLMMGISYLTSF